MPSSISEDDVDARNTIKRDQLNILIGQLPQALAVTVINAAALAYIQSSAVDPVSAWCWFGAVAFLTYLRLALYYFYRSDQVSHEETIVFERLFFVGVLASGIAWGTASVLLFPSESYVHQAFIGFVLAGMTAGAVGSLSTSHYMFLAFMLPACTPYAINLFLQDGTLQDAMGIMTVAFIGATWLTSKKSCDTTCEVLQLRYENVALVHRLGAANKILQQEIRTRSGVEDTPPASAQDLNEDKSQEPTPVIPLHSRALAHKRSY